MKRCGQQVPRGGEGGRACAGWAEPQRVSGVHLLLLLLTHYPQTIIPDTLFFNPLTTNRRFSDGHFGRFLPIFSSGLAESIFMKISGIVYLYNLNTYSKNQTSNLKIDHFIASAVKSLKKFFFTVQKNAKNALENSKNSFFYFDSQKKPTQEAYKT